MPLIVDEVIISVEVTPAAGGAAPGAPASTEDTQALVSECVERVLEVLRQREER